MIEFPIRRPMAWEGERGGVFFRLRLTADRIWDRIVFDRFPKKMAQFFFDYF